MCRVTIALEVPYQEGQRKPTFTNKIFHVGLPYYLGLNSGRPVSIKRSQNVGAFSQQHSQSSQRVHVSPMYPSFVIRETLFPASILFPKCKLCSRYTVENFNENPSMREVAKILRARASEHSSYFCEKFEQRPNFVSTFKLNGTIRYTYP